MLNICIHSHRFLTQGYRKKKLKHIFFKFSKYYNFKDTYDVIPNIITVNSTTLPNSWMTTDLPISPSVTEPISPIMCTAASLGICTPAYPSGYLPAS